MKTASAPTALSDAASLNGERVDVSNALSILRPTLGDNAGIALYRLLRLVALEDIIGRGAAGTAYIAGKKLGNGLGLRTLDDFLALCTSLKIGVIEVPVLTPNQAHVDVYECVTCAGMAPVGRTLCSFEGGLIAGVVESVTRKRARAREVTCIGGLGHEACGFDIEME
ncbi:MAG TPA: V4R domain-containing protein [Kofleriaceae bacterium]|jgi:predicted hydrocarbon binding protein|nr:V4R domain-containing protein [Kofleriaceae bacterium]